MIVYGIPNRQTISDYKVFVDHLLYGDRGERPTS